MGFWRRRKGSKQTADREQPPPADQEATSKLEEIATTAFTTIEAEQMERAAAPEAVETTPLAFRAVRGGLWLLGSSYWSLGFGFVANILLTRLLTPQIYGEFALAMFFFTLFQLRSKLGLNFAFAQQKSVTGETVGTYFSLDVFLGFTSLVLMLIATPVLLAFHYPPMVVITALILSAMALIESFFGVFGVVLETQLHFKPGSIISSVVMPLSYIPAFWLALNHHGEYSLVAQAVTLSIATLIASLIYIGRAMRPLFALRWRVQTALALNYLRFGATTGVGNFIAGLIPQMDNFILGTVAGVEVLGYYDRAFRLAQWPSLLLNAVVGRAAIFTYSQLRGDNQRLRRSATMMLWIAANLASPMALALFFSAPDFVPLLFGTQWLPVVPILRFLLIASIARPLWDNFGALLIGIGQPQRIIQMSVIQLVILIGLGTPLAYWQGATGMAAAVALTMVVGVVVAYLLLRRTFTLPLWDIFGGPLVAVVLTMAGYWVLVRVIGSAYPSWLAVIWKGAYAVLAFTAFSALVQPRQFNERIRYILRLARGQGA